MRLLALWVSILIGAFILWAAVSDNPAVWTVRNTLEYHVTRSWWSLTGEPVASKSGDVAGRVTNRLGKAIPKAVVLLSEWDGRVHTAQTDADGTYRISGMPIGFYRVAAAATGYDSVQSGGLLRGVTVRPGLQAEASFCMNPSQKKRLSPLAVPQNVDPQTLVCTSPIPGQALRETLKFSDTALSNLIFLYRPTQMMDRPLPVLLAVYPGPVDTWECVSIGLAQAGYAVVAIGPAYGMELTPDVDVLERLVMMIRQGGLAGTDPSRVAALGGSYSALLLELLALRDTGLDAMVLLGPPTDMFDFRRRFEREGFVPPFGLDRALVALGLPSRDPLRYMNHSMVYQTRPGLPATLVFHSYQDEIVPYQQSGLLVESLRRQGVEAELRLFEGASHYLLEDGEAAVSIYHQTLEFLRRHGMAPFLRKGELE